MKSLLSSLDLTSFTGTQPLDPGLERIVEAAVARLQAGETFDLERLVAEYPEQAEELRRLLPMMVALVELRGAAGDCTEAAANNGEPIPLPYKELGDFRLIRELGRGGMGTVFEAEQLSMGRRVALKVLPFAALAHDKSLQRFRNEVRAAAALDHPNIVSVYSVGEDRGIHYYAMQLIRGQTLADLITGLQAESNSIRASDESTRNGQAHVRTVLDSRQAAERFRSVVRLGIQAAEALQHAHVQGVLHRDIKPSNLMLDAEGQLYVTDFGLARIEADAGMTMTGDIIGTLRYMAPEQALSKRVVIDHRADIYALGATLYELLALQPTFGESDRAALLKQIAFDEPTSLRKLDRRISAELETIVLKAMAKNPDERYETAQRMADDLRAFLEYRPIKAQRPSTVSLLSKWSRRHRSWVCAIASAAMIAAIAIAGSIGWSMRDRQSRRAAIERQLTETIESIRTAYENDDVETAIAVTRSAESLSNMGDVDVKLQNAVRQWQFDLETIYRLEEIHSSMTLLRRGKFDLTIAAPKFVEALTDYGLILDEAESDANIDRLRRSRIGLRLVLFMDTLSIVERSDLRPTFVRLANAVDGDRWRKSFRTAILKKDTHALETLAEAEDCRLQPSVSISNIIIQLYISGNKQAAIELLRRYQQSRPSDFWINHMLGTLLNDADASPTEAVGYLRVAVSIRPNSSPARNNLGVALARVGQTDEIEMQYREAARLDPLDPTPCMNLAYMFQGTRPRERAEWGRKAHELDPTIPDAHYMIAEGYELDGNYQASIEWNRRYLTLEQGDWGVLVDIARCQFKLGKNNDAEATLKEVLNLAPGNQNWIEAAADLLNTYLGRDSADEYRRTAERLSKASIGRLKSG